MYLFSQGKNSEAVTITVTQLSENVATILLEYVVLDVSVQPLSQIICDGGFLRRIYFRRIKIEK